MEKKSTLHWEMLPCGLTLATWLDVSTRHITKQDDQLLGIDCDASSPAAVRIGPSGMAAAVAERTACCRAAFSRRQFNSALE